MRPFRTSAAVVMILLLLQTSAYAYSSSVDTDGDGVADGIEDENGNEVLDTGETDPFNADTDGGGESDGSELNNKRSPFDKTDDFTFDSDGDGWVNGVEYREKTDPKVADTDGDGVSDPEDAFPLDSKYQTDTNANNLPDEWEKQTALDQKQVTQQTVDDPDGDGLNNAEEFSRGTDPLETDTDRDGIDDKTELDAATDPRENACLSYGSETDGFLDTIGHWSEQFVNKLQRTLILPDGTPIVRGYGEGLFKPDQTVTRFEFLKMVMLSTCTKLRNNSDLEEVSFSDVLKTSRVNEHPDATLRRKVIYTAVHHKIVEGYDDGTFKADAPVNRAEALKILSLATRLQISESGSTLVFVDVRPEDWFSQYVAAASSREIVSGYGDGTFGPGNFITRAEAAKIIYLTMLQNPVINGYVLLED